jgi:hypothetical protein
MTHSGFFWFDTKSVEYRLVMGRGTHARGKRQRGINNQFLITRFSIIPLDKGFLGW